MLQPVCRTSCTAAPQKGRVSMKIRAVTMSSSNCKAASRSARSSWGIMRDNDALFAVHNSTNPFRHCCFEGTSSSFVKARVPSLCRVSKVRIPMLCFCSVARRLSRRCNQASASCLLITFFLAFSCSILSFSLFCRTCHLSFSCFWTIFERLPSSCVCLLACAASSCLCCFSNATRTLF